MMQRCCVDWHLMSTGKPEYQVPISFIEGECVGTLVYVVDDEVIIAKTLAEILKRSGFEAVAFFDSLEALKSAESTVPDLLIADVMMPGLNGVDLGMKFTALHPESKVLLLSGLASTSHLTEDATNKGHQFKSMTKPFHPNDLIKEVTRLTAGKTPVV